MFEDILIAYASIMGVFTVSVIGCYYFLIRNVDKSR